MDLTGVKSFKMVIFISKHRCKQMFNKPGSTVCVLEGRVRRRGLDFVRVDYSKLSKLEVIKSKAVKRGL